MMIFPPLEEEEQAGNMEQGTEPSSNLVTPILEEARSIRTSTTNLLQANLDLQANLVQAETILLFHFSLIKC